EAFSLSLRTLNLAVSLYASHFALITGISLVPALSRMLYFLGVFGSGALAGIFEIFVGIFRIALFYIVFRLVWPQVRSVAQGDPGRLQLSPIPWPEIFWNAVVIGAVVLSLNLGAYWLAGQVSPIVPRMESAITFGLKNLFV